MVYSKVSRVGSFQCSHAASAAYVFALLGHHDRSSVYARRFRLLPMGLIPSPLAGGSADPSTNAALATVLRAAKSSGVPKANIENALKKVRDPTRGPWLTTHVG